MRERKEALLGQGCTKGNQSRHDERKRKEERKEGGRRGGRAAKEGDAKRSSTRVLKSTLGPAVAPSSGLDCEESPCWASPHSLLRIRSVLVGGRLQRMRKKEERG